MLVVLAANLPPLFVQLMYYWVGVTEAVKTWIKACAVCQSRNPTEPPEPPVQFCLAYGCDASSYIYPELSFLRSDGFDGSKAENPCVFCLTVIIRLSLHQFKLFNSIKAHRKAK